MRINRVSFLPSMTAPKFYNGFIETSNKGSRLPTMHNDLKKLLKNAAASSHIIISFSLIEISYWIDFRFVSKFQAWWSRMVLYLEFWIAWLAGPQISGLKPCQLSNNFRRLKILTTKLKKGLKDLQKWNSVFNDVWKVLHYEIFLGVK